ncbi:MAG: hypothetical protein MHM6MM_000354 [Cercozoa sp. M6MM]
MGVVRGREAITRSFRFLAQAVEGLEQHAVDELHDCLACSSDPASFNMENVEILGVGFFVFDVPVGEPNAKRRKLSEQTESVEDGADTASTDENDADNLSILCELMRRLARSQCCARICALAYECKLVDINAAKEEAMDVLRQAAKESDFDDARRLWKAMVLSHEQPLSRAANPSIIARYRKKHRKGKSGDIDLDKPLFRVTCDRVTSMKLEKQSGGSFKHSFQSPDVAMAVGVALRQKDADLWNASLSLPDLTVYTLVLDDRVFLCVSLYCEMWTRVFTTDGLKAHLAHSLVRRTRMLEMARQLQDDSEPLQCVDVMCGLGTIPLCGVLQAQRYQLTQRVRWQGGDIAPKSIKKAQENVKSLSSVFETKAPQFQVWDATALPLADKSVDLILCDMPFGRRHNSHKANAKMYPKALRECRRILRSRDDVKLPEGTGNVFLLTLERNLLHRCLAESAPYFEVISDASCDVGGFRHCALFELRLKADADATEADSAPEQIAAAMP